MRLALQLIAFALTSAIFFGALWLLWFIIVVYGTGGAMTECDRGDCGTLGEFASDTWPLLMVIFGLLSLVGAWLVARGRPRRAEVASRKR